MVDVNDSSDPWGRAANGHDLTLLPTFLCSIHAESASDQLVSARFGTCRIHRGRIGLRSLNGRRTD